MGIKANEVQEHLKKHILADGLHIIFDAVKSRGAMVSDLATGRQYLDLFSFFATQPIGYNHPKMTDPTFKAKLADAAVHRPSLSDVYTPEYAEAVDTFVRVCGKNQFSHYFFIEGGTLGVENALKAAFDWKVRKNMEKGLPESDMQVIHFENAFHGRSGYGLSLTNTADPKKYQYFPKFKWPRIKSPALSFPVTKEVTERTIEQETFALNQIKEALQKNPNQLACLIIEPIQAEGGDRHFRKEFFKSLRDLADAHEFMLIADEVQTGIGITGKMWGFEHCEFKPDLVAFGKKVQVAGCAATSRIDEIKDNVFSLSSRINSTWGGNLVDFVRLQRYLEIIEEEKLVEHTKNVGEFFLSELQALSQKYPILSNVRGVGLMLAFDLPNSETRAKFHRKLFDEGAVTLTCGEKSIRIRAHLDFPREKVTHAIHIFENVCKSL